MERFKRFLAAVVMVISALGLILCLAGIIGIWMVNTPLTDTITETLDQAEAVLVFSRDRLDLVTAELTAAQDLLTNLGETVIAAGEDLTDKSPTLTFISNRIGTELKPRLETTAEVVKTIRGTVVSVNNTLETADSIPFVSVPTLPMEELAAIDQQMQEAVEAVKSLGETIKDVESGVIESASTVIMVPVEKLSNLIDRVLPPVISFDTTLARVNTGVENANARIPALIDWASVLITIVSCWFALAQASLLYGGWYYWKIGRIPTVQIPSLSNSSGG